MLHSRFWQWLSNTIVGDFTYAALIMAGGLVAMHYVVSLGG
nr:hypothetical protein REQ54_04313 [Rhizobium sp. Q54]